MCSRAGIGPGNSRRTSSPAARRAKHAGWRPSGARGALVPPAHRARAGQLIDELGEVLRRWLWARLISMTVLGIASAIGLWLLGIPLALSLGLLAGALLFVPYLGSSASAIPALLIAFTVDPMHEVYVGALYIGWCSRASWYAARCGESSA